MSIVSEHAGRNRTLRLRPVPSIGWILLSAAVALLIWVVAVPVLGIVLVVEFPGSPPLAVSPVSVAAVPLIAGLLAWGMLVVLTRFLRAGLTLWRIFALALLVLSLSGPVFGGTSVAVTTTLSLMHLAVAGVLIVGLPWAGRKATSKQQRMQAGS